MLSFAEENYLKAIYHLSDGGKAQVSTNSIADHIHTKAASVSDMVKRLAIKKLVSHKRYQGVNVTSSGKLEALKIIRKHRLWEVFLVQKLKYSLRLPLTQKWVYHYLFLSQVIHRIQYDPTP